MKSLYVVIVTFLCVSPAFSEETNDLEDINDSVKLTIACSNSVFQLPTNVLISVSITNSSAHVIGFSAPICELEQFEVWVTDSTGHSVDIGPKLKPTNGPRPGINTFYRISPNKSAECTVELRVDNRMQPGKYRLAMKRWCFVFTYGEDGKAISNLLRTGHLVSNPVTIEIY
jgi:hypothetical protein